MKSLQQNSKILIVGSSGQTGSYLSEYLLRSNTKVYGLTRSKVKYRFESHYNFTRFEFNYASHSDFYKYLVEVKPDIIFNLASMSSVSKCALEPNLSFLTNYDLLEKLCNAVIRYQDVFSHRVKLIQASSSEMYTGDKNLSLVSETTPLNPGSLYGEHKSMAHLYMERLRKSGEIDSSCAIMFNHESARRSDNFVTKKIVNFVNNFVKYGTRKINLGNIQIRRDWGYAKDYAEILHKIAVNDKIGNYIVASGKLNSIENFLDQALEYRSINRKDIELELDPTLYRDDHPGLAGNIETTIERLGKLPTTSFSDLVKIVFSSESNSYL
jgi:GDPmannose 4,6-dehydratase